MAEFDADPTNKRTGIAKFCRKCTQMKARLTAQIIESGRGTG